MGIGNWKNAKQSGEAYLLSRLAKMDCLKTVVDVGANAGHYTQAVLALQKDAQIWAFEPHPKTFARLQAAYGETPNVRLTQAAVGSLDEHGKTLELWDYAGQDGSEHASLHKSSVVNQQAKKQAFSVPVVALDKVLASLEQEIDLLKIDTEGHELAVLKGAAKLLKSGRVRCIHFEFNTTHLGQSTFRDFWEMLSPQYKLYRLLPKGLLPIARYDARLLEIYHYQNFLAVQKGREH